MKILIKILFSTVFILNILKINAQPSNQHIPPAGSIITGTVEDQTSSKPVEYANVALFKSQDSSLVNGTVSDANGVFKIEGVAAGKYYLRISFIGFKTKMVSNVAVTSQKKEVNLGKIIVEANEASLGEVTVTTDRKTIEFNLDKKVVNVASNMAATVGGTAVDVLQNVPSITVDQDGNVSLRGNSNVTILIDGRPSTLTGSNLKQIPASAIETVELVTNPSARYNPEGVSGIINIKLKKKIDAGFNGMVNVTVGTKEKYNGSVNLNYNLGKVNFFSTIDYRNDKRPGSGKSDRYTYLKDTTKTIMVDTSLYRENANAERKGLSKGLKLGADIQLNKKNTLTFTWMGRLGDDSDKDTTLASTEYTNLYYNYNNINTTSRQKESEDDKSFDYTINYRKTFDKKDQEFTADLIVNTRNGDETSDLFANYTGDTTYTKNTHATTGSKNTTTTFQFNYVYPFAKTWKLETGWQSKLIDMESNYNYYNYSVTEWVEDKDKSNDLTYSQYVHAGYATLGSTLGKYSFQAGLRLEQSYIKINQQPTDKKYNDNYFNFYPTLHLSRKLAGDRDIQISYSRRINRPNMWLLNPAPDYSNPNSVRMGNPELTPEYINSYELGYSRQMKKTSLNATLFYRKTNDVINRTMTNETDPKTGEIITYMKPENITSAQSYGLELIGETALAKWWRISGNASFFKNTVKKSDSENSSDNMTNDNFSYNARLLSNMMIPKLFSLQISAFYRGPMVQINSEMDPMYSVDMAIQKNFFKDKFTVSVRVSDIFNTMKFKVKTFDETFDNQMERKFNSQVVYLSLTYKIGGIGAKPQKQQRNTGGEENGGGMDY